MTTNRDVLVKAAADAVAARLAIDAAARRRSAATAAAQNLMDLATATERAERDAAWSALGASVHILVAEHVAIGDIAELCGMSADFIRELSDAGPGGTPATTDGSPRLPLSRRHFRPTAARNHLRRECARRPATRRERRPPTTTP